MSEKELIDRLASLIAKDTSFQIAKVESVTGLKCLVKPITGEIEISGVSLSFDEEPDFYAVPAVGSIVVVGFYKINKLESRHFIVLATKVSSIILNGDQFGGLVKAPVLSQELEKLQEFCESLKSGTRAALSSLNAVVPGLTGAFDLTMTGKTTGDFNSLENQNVKHG